MYKYVRVKNYYELGFENMPVFVLIMEVNGEYKEYISSGCGFEENTEENRKILSDRWGCEVETELLLNSDGISNDEITDTRYMFSGAKKLEIFDVDMPKLRNARSMFKGCKNLKIFKSKMPLITNTKNMFQDGKKIETFESNLTNNPL